MAVLFMMTIRQKTFYKLFADVCRRLFVNSITHFFVIEYHKKRVSN